MLTSGQQRIIYGSKATLNLEKGTVASGMQSSIFGFKVTLYVVRASMREVGFVTMAPDILAAPAPLTGTGTADLGVKGGRWRVRSTGFTNTSGVSVSVAQVCRVGRPIHFAWSRHLDLPSNNALLIGEVQMVFRCWCGAVMQQKMVGDHTAALWCQKCTRGRWWSIWP